MSLHLMDCVKPLKLQPSMKLALMAFADSAGDNGRIGRPGLEGVMAWACVGRSQAQQLVNDLVAAGLLRSHSRGHKGRVARYVVFPSGCCDAHGAAAGVDPHAGVLEVAAALGVDLSGDQLTALTALADAQGPADRHQSETEGSGPPDSVHREGSGTPDPLPNEASGTPAPQPADTPDPPPESASGTGKGPAHRTRLLGFKTTTPPTPHASGAGGEPCPAHKPSGSFGDNCRGCGTTPRQLQKRAARAAALEAAAAAGPRCPAGTRWAGDGFCGCPPPVAHPMRHELDQAAAS